MAVYLNEFNMYKPGQLVTIKIGDFRKVLRIKRTVNGNVSCKECDLFLYRLDLKTFNKTCYKYCARRHNDWLKHPNGYILRAIAPKRI